MRLSINDYYICILCHHNLIHLDQLNSVLRSSSHIPPTHQNDLEAILVQEASNRCGSFVNGETWNRAWREIMADTLRVNWKVFGLCDMCLEGKREMIVFRWYGFSLMDTASTLECEEYEGCCWMLWLMHRVYLRRHTGISLLGELSPPCLRLSSCMDSPH